MMMKPISMGTICALCHLNLPKLTIHFFPFSSLNFFERQKIYSVINWKSLSEQRSDEVDAFSHSATKEVELLNVKYIGKVFFSSAYSYFATSKGSYFLAFETIACAVLLFVPSMCARHLSRELKSKENNV